MLISLALSLTLLTNEAWSTKKHEKTPLEIVVEDLRKCSVTKNHMARLKCYDVFSEEKGFITKEKREKRVEGLGQFGFWRMEGETSVKGQITTYLRLDSTNEILTEARVKKSPTFIISCTQGTTNAYLDWKGPLKRSAYDRNIYVSYKIGEDPPQPEQWELSMDRYAAFSPRSTEFVRELLSSDSLLIQITPADDSTMTLRFNLEGLQNALDLLVERCYKRH